MIDHFFVPFIFGGQYIAILIHVELSLQPFRINSDEIDAFMIAL